MPYLIIEAVSYIVPVIEHHSHFFHMFRVIVQALF